MNTPEATSRAIALCPDRTVKVSEDYWSVQHGDCRTEGSECGIYILPGLNGAPCQSFTGPSFQSCLAQIGEAIEKLQAS